MELAVREALASAGITSSTANPPDFNRVAGAVASAMATAIERTVHHLEGQQQEVNQEEVDGLRTANSFQGREIEQLRTQVETLAHELEEYEKALRQKDVQLEEYVKVVHEKKVRKPTNDKTLQTLLAAGNASEYPFPPSVGEIVVQAENGDLEGLYHVYISLGMHCRSLRQENQLLRSVIEQMKVESTRRQEIQQMQIKTLHLKLQDAILAQASLSSSEDEGVEELAVVESLDVDLGLGLRFATALLCLCSCCVPVCVFVWCVCVFFSVFV
jgi:hypothetical protein